MASVGTEGKPKEDEGRASEQAQSAAIAAGSADAGGNDAAAQGQTADEYDHSDPLQMHPRAAFWVRELLRKGRKEHSIQHRYGIGAEDILTLLRAENYLRGDVPEDEHTVTCMRLALIHVVHEVPMRNPRRDREGRIFIRGARAVEAAVYRFEQLYQADEDHDKVVQDSLRIWIERARGVDRFNAGKFDLPGWDGKHHNLLIKDKLKEWSEEDKPTRNYKRIGLSAEQLVDFLCTYGVDTSPMATDEDDSGRQLAATVMDRAIMQADEVPGGEAGGKKNLLGRLTDSEGVHRVCGTEAIKQVLRAFNTLAEEERPTAPQELFEGKDLSEGDDEADVEEEALMIKFMREHSSHGAGLVGGAAGGAAAGPASGSGAGAGSGGAGGGASAGDAAADGSPNHEWYSPQEVRSLKEQLEKVRRDAEVNKQSAVQQTMAKDALQAKVADLEQRLRDAEAQGGCCVVA